jgi:hypothetical protein
LVGSAPFFGFLFYYYISFAFALHATSMKFNNADPVYGFYDHVGDHVFLPYFIYVFRSTMGDQSTYGISSLPSAVMYATWFLWVTQVFMGLPFLMNFLITIINIAYSSEMTVKLEESYKKKAQILSDLNDVFGKYLRFYPVNILVTRRPMENTARKQVDSNI